jgi:putative transposase
LGKDERGGDKLAGRKATVVNLTEQERQMLEQLVRRHTVGQQIALRAWVVLAAAEGKTSSQIRDEYHVTINTVRLWRDRWVKLQRISYDDLSAEERLEDTARTGAPSRITAEQRCKIEALACQKPEEHQRPITNWTAREIAAEIIHQGIVEQISPRHAARLLKRCRSKTALEPLLVDHQAG